MKISIEVDLSDIFIDTEEGETLTTAIKEEITRTVRDEVARKVLDRVSISAIEKECNANYKEKLEKQLGYAADSIKWLSDNSVANTIANVVKKGAAEIIVKELRNDPEFIKAVAGSLFNK